MVFCSSVKVGPHFKGVGLSVKNCWAGGGGGGMGGYTMRLHVLQDCVTLLKRTILNQKYMYVIQLLTEHYFKRSLKKLGSL